ncbi:UDP-N-acetylmuramoyl-tripeptide--D-alanyl-D-alanine ligase [mine drainage metagenome]|uniref:UDP-MurNAc-pentapeptide synthetase n=1 Tax=mine drainage metagenome TaxID=410659 RepID=A0A1J5QMN0_9ZZZZ
MIALTAAELAALVDGALVGHVDRDALVSGPVVIDSRLAEPGAVFVALRGEHLDGHDYAAAAVDAGARVVLTERVLAGASGALPCIVVTEVAGALGALARGVLTRLRGRGADADGREAAAPVVVGVTGSVGKTTTKDLLAQLLSADAPTVAAAESFNNPIGLPLTVLRADETTRYLVLEMGASGVGHIAELTRIARPDVAVVLAVGHAHLAGFGGIDAVARTKAEIVRALTPQGVAVLNADDPRVAEMAGVAPGRVVTFGTSQTADVQARDVRVDRAGRASFILATPSATAPVRLRLVGDHHVTNALAAAAVALELGVALEDVAVRLGAAEALSAHRMHVVDRVDGVTVLDDSYNANPDSMRAALKALATIAGRDRRSVAVLGEMLELGAGSRDEHDAIGCLLVDLGIGLAVVVGAGAGAIADGAGRAGPAGGDVRRVEDVVAAGALLQAELRPGDVVLVKSSHGAGLWRLADELVGTEDRP